MSNPQAMTLYSRFIAGLCRFGLQSIARVRVEGLEDLPTEQATEMTLFIIALLVADEQRRQAEAAAAE